MNNNKLKNYKSNSITRITEIFKTIFSRKRTEKSNTDEEQSAVIENNKRQKFLEQIEDKSNSASKVASKVARKVEMLSKIENDENKLKEMSIEELKELSIYYNEIIERNNIIIEKLKKSA